jgi:hypothetical protein
LALGVTLCAQGEVDNCATVKKGAVVWLLHEATTEATGNVQGRELKTVQTTTRTLCLTVKDVDAEGNFQIETKIVRVQGRVEMAMGQGEFDFDSAASEDDGAAPMAGMKKQMIAGAGMTFLAKVSPFGQALALGEGADAVLAASKEARSNMHALGRASLGQLVADVFGVLPKKRTAGGAVWQFAGPRYCGKLPLAAKLQMTLSKVDIETFEIEGEGTADIAKDVLAGNQDIPAEEAAEVARQMKSTTVSNGKITRKQTTSRTDGFVASATELIEMDVETRDSVAGAFTMHMKMASSLRRTTEAEALPKKVEAAKTAEAPKK